MKHFTTYQITNITEEADETYILQVSKPDKSDVFPFKAGQYVYIKNSKSSSPKEEHPFSLASSPKDKKYLEFCIKVLGDWTSEIPSLQKGDLLHLSEPEGQFHFRDDIAYAVMLVGGVGLSPSMSILRDLAKVHSDVPITMLYGSRIERTIVYRDELERLQQDLPHLNIVYVLSHVTPDDPWTGYRGFFSKEILENEVDFSKQPTFFVSGPPIFITKMDELLTSLSVSRKQILQELLTEKTNDKAL